MLLYPKHKRKKVVLPRYSQNPNQDLEIFLNFCKQADSQADLELLRKAFAFNLNSCKEKSKRSGDPHYTHPLEVATILINFIGFDNVLIASALLHEVIGRDSPFTINDIESEFGKVIAQIVESIHKIDTVEHQRIGDAEYYRRLILSLLTDIRILLIKIADRYHDMQTISYLSPEKQMKFAEDTMQLYVPLAHRLGLALIKSELEDFAFKVLDRQNYEAIARKLNMSKRERENKLQEFVKPLIPKLESKLKEEYNVSFEIHGRVKHIYSIYNKTLLRGKPIEELYDLIGIRIILDTDNENLCYEVLETIAEVYKKIDNTFKDYIKNPKPNGYQSLHQAFQVSELFNVEVQVRTRKMDEIAERGFAAHYRYKSGLVSADSILMDPDFENWTNEVRKLLLENEELSDSKIFEAFNFNLLSEKIYVLTPENDVKVLPKGATVLDFAYSIHTDLGNHCLGAKIDNKRTCGPFEKLSNGNIVQILYSERVEPDESWLDHVVTSKAKDAIKKYLAQKRQSLITSGKGIFSNLIKEYKLSSKENSILSEVKNIFLFPDSDEFFMELHNDTELQQNIKDLLAFISSNESFTKTLKWKTLINKLPTKIKQYIETRVKNFFEKHPEKIDFAICCLPVRNDDAIAIFQNDSIKIHRKECTNYAEELKKINTRITNFKWDYIKQEKFLTCLKISSPKPDLVLSRLTLFFSGIEDAEIKRIIKEEEQDGVFSLTLFLLVEDKSTIEKLKSQLLDSSSEITIVRKGKRRD